MPNPIKYTAGTETLALKKGNFYIGTGDVGKGPSDTTGYYQGPSPASGGYVIYLNKSGVPGNLSYHSATNDAQLISFTNNLSGTSFTSATQCLNYYSTQTDKVCFNIDYPPIVTNGLVLNLDAGFTPSYSQSGITWYDVSLGGNNGTLTNGPTFNSGNGGSIVFDGTNDYCSFNIDSSLITNAGEMTFNVWYKYTTSTQDTSLLEIGGNYNHWSLYWDSVAKTILTFSVTGSYNNRVQSTTNTRTGVWFNSCGTYSSTSTKIYTNGFLEGTIANQTLLSQTGVKEGRIAADNGTVNYMGGNVAIVQIYNRALSATEVLQNYNATKGRFGL
jgi:hypothetical protein